MAAQTPITFVGTFPNITGLTQLKTGDTLSGVVNHVDFSPNSLMFADSAGTVAAVVIPENTVLGNTGSGITSLTMATLAPLVASNINIDDLFTSSGLSDGDVAVYSANTGAWYNQTNSLANLADVTLTSVTAGDFLVHDGTSWAAQDGPPVDGQIYGYQNGAWARVPISDGSGGTLDHSALGNLLVDTHTQYLTNERGDARYYQKAQLNSFLSNKAPLSHQHVLTDITDAGALAGKSTVAEIDLADQAVSSAKISGSGSTTGQVLSSQGPADAPAWTSVPDGLSITVTATSVGTKNYFVATTNWRITGWYLISTSDGTTIELDVLKASGAVPNPTQSIVGTEPPSLLNAQLSSDLELTTWTELDVSVGDVIGVSVTSTNSASELATLSLVGYRI
jgi:hypothetical protein